LKGLATGGTNSTPNSADVKGRQNKPQVQKKRKNVAISTRSTKNA